MDPERESPGVVYTTTDEAFILFRQVEVCVRKYSTFGAQRVTSESQDTKGILQEISKNNEIQFHWSMLPSCIDNHDHEQELLSCIMRLWLSIRGHSVAGQWMEEYKQIA